MKIFAFLSVLCVPFLLPILVEAEDEDFVRVIIPPSVKYFDSDGKSVVNTLNAHHRSIRMPTSCKFPDSMEDSQLDCKLYPNRVHCTQTCTFGNTLSEGIQREMKCRYDENKWEPVPNFERCQPFVDCTLSIKAGGKFKCYTNYLLKGPNCEVSCQRYEDKPAVPSSSYQCDIKGSWSPKLPFCSRPGSGVKLVPPPSGPQVIFSKSS